MSVVNVPQVAGVAEKDNIIYESFQRIIDQANSGFDSTNTNVTTITGSLTAVPAGYVMYGTGTIAVGYDSNLRWDPTNHWLGIGTTPGTILETRATGAPSFTRVVTVPGQQGAINIGLTGTGSRTAGDGPSLLMFGDNAAGSFSYMGRISSRWVNPAAGSESTCVTLSVRANSADAAVQTEAIRIFPSTKVSIGTTSERQQLSVNGMIESMATGFKFPDATTQATAGVLPTRTISTTLPLTGGGDLSANRTFAINSFAGSAAGAVPTSLGGTTNFLRADGSWAVPPGIGTVTSVDVSGGTTGLTYSGGPITSSGTITMAGTLNVVNGGTQRTSLTAGNILYGAGTSAVGLNANFYFDSVNTRLGVGTSVPGNIIDAATSSDAAIGVISTSTLKYARTIYQSSTKTWLCGLQNDSSGSFGVSDTNGFLLHGFYDSGGHTFLAGIGMTAASPYALSVNGHVNIPTANGYYVDGNKVVTNRQAGVSAALASRTAGATYGATEQTMLQEAHDAIRTLLVALRTHGLIS